MSKIILSVVILLLSVIAVAAPLPYDETADANAELKQTLSVAGNSKKPVLVIFGANWCEDCRALDHALKSAKNAKLMEQEFLVVKIDVGNFDHNLDIDRAYGDPIKQGIPAAVVLSPDNKVMYATRGGELADARRMSDTGVYKFFKQIVQTARQ